MHYLNAFVTFVDDFMIVNLGLIKMFLQINFVYISLLIICVLFLMRGRRN